MNTEAAIYAIPHDRQSLTVVTVRPWRTAPSVPWTLRLSPSPDDGSPVPIGPWHTTGRISGGGARAAGGDGDGNVEPQPDVTYAKTVVDGLKPGVSYQIRLMELDRVVAHCRGRPLPSGDETAATLVFGSCHGISDEAPEAAQRARFLTAAYDRLSAGAGSNPIYSAWLGDQVYLDEPWKDGFFRLDFHRRILDRYRDTLGLSDRRSGLATVLSRGSNLFIPDDHEFWNNYPRASFFTLPLHTARRAAEQLARFVFRSDKSPHPYFHGGWGRTAGAAYMAFQSADGTPFTDFSPDVSPRALQEFELAGAQLVLIDTRWHRTLRLKDPKGAARFLTENDFAALEKILATDKLVVLGLAKPIVGSLAPSGWFNEGLEIGPENYRKQYLAFWALLNARAARGAPTAVVAGDVHHHSVSTALNDALVEFVCSPMSPIDSLNNKAAKEKKGEAGARLRLLPSSPLARLRRNVVPVVLKRAKAGKARVSRFGNNTQSMVRRRRLLPFNPNNDPSCGHHVLIDGKPSIGDGRFLFPLPDTSGRPHKDERPGLAALDISCPPDGPIVLTYRAEFDGPDRYRRPDPTPIRLEWTETGWRQVVVLDPADPTKPADSPSGTVSSERLELTVPE